MIGNRLCVLRENLGLKQKDVAKRLGLSQAAYSRYENNKREPDVNTLKLIANFFNVSIDYLLGNMKFKRQEKGFSRDMERLFDKMSASDAETLAELEQYLNYLETKKNQVKNFNHDSK